MEKFFVVSFDYVENHQSHDSDAAGGKLVLPEVLHGLSEGVLVPAFLRSVAELFCCGGAKRLKQVFVGHFDHPQVHNEWIKPAFLVIGVIEVI